MASQAVHDPVCHMDITIGDAAGSSEHGGTTYYFYAVGCKSDSDEDPDGILQEEATYDHSQPMDHVMASREDAGSSSPWWRFWSR